ncbi:MAG: selenocysteine-specific translation elongation factor [Defluviitaleaceae bacterium]|nr:selenocysteine-specific translation elongation factor [Defluviitaleaceae bacterium]
MNNAIIGTAGHVDHGKTLLIKALTGMDTDRLQEEKKRGITIEPGFAYLTLADNKKAGIIDVPGHEKFIKNMLLGAGSIDLAMLVVAADEGFMPQTREHLAILSMLGIKQGVIVLNKVDLVDNDWLEMLTLEVEDEVKETFLQNSKIIPVSAYSGEGIQILKEHIFDLLACSPQKNEIAPFRLPIDRVFTMEGFGTVVTGTLIEGTLCEGDDVALYPSMKLTKARRVQVYGDKVDSAKSGQRVAVNLPQIKLSDIDRGDVLAMPESMENTRLLDVRIDILNDCEREIVNHSRLHLHHGAKDMLCRISLLGKNKIKKGETGYAQLHLTEPLAAKYGDAFVLRFYSPLETIGGGVILDPLPKKIRKNDENAPARLKTKESGTIEDKIAVITKERSEDFPSATYIKKRFFNNEAAFDQALDNLTICKKLYCINQSVIHQDFLNELGCRSQNLLEDYHKKNPLHIGMPKKEFCNRLLNSVEQNIVDEIVTLLCTMGYIYNKENNLAHKDFKIAMSESHQKIQKAVLKLFLEAGYSPQSIDEIESMFAKEKKAFKQSLESLSKNGELVVLTPQIYMHSVHYKTGLDLFKEMAMAQETVTLAQYRDALGASRKYAMALLEYFDKKAITKKIGDARVLV